MAFTHKYTKIYPGNPEGKKPAFLELHLALFVSFIALYKIFTIQYKISTNLQNPNSNSKIRNPWAEKPNTMDRKTAYHNTAKNDPKNFFRGLRPRTPKSALRITVFELTLGKPTGGALAGYPPVTPLRRARRRRIARDTS